MQFLLLVYIDDALIGQVSPAEYDAHMRDCLRQADALQAQGRVVGFQQLEPPARARAVRVRGGRSTVVDGPFAETKEMLAGFTQVDAASLDDAVRMAQELPWARYGCIEVRPVRDIAEVRARVGA